MSEVKLYDAADLDSDEWRQLQTISRESFATTLVDRNMEEIDALIEWNDPGSYYDSHVDPNTLVGGRYDANQSYAKPRVAVATQSGEPVGFAYSAHNVSGATEAERVVKRLSVVKNYLWLRELAVKPELQRQGIATDLGRALLKDANPLQPPTAYVWPDEFSWLRGNLQQLGFADTGTQQVRVFGEDSTPIRQVRLQAPSVRHVLKRL